MTKVHAFQIAHVERHDWMFHDDPSYTIYGHNPKEVVRPDLETMQLFEPEIGHYYIVWPHGLVTFRDEETFRKDFRYLSGTVYETELEALFQKGMLEEELMVPLFRKHQAKLELQREFDERRKKQVLEGTVFIKDGYIRRVVIPGLIDVEPAGFRLN